MSSSVKQMPVKCVQHTLLFLQDVGAELLGTKEHIER